MIEFCRSVNVISQSNTQYKNNGHFLHYNLIIFYSLFHTFLFYFHVFLYCISLLISLLFALGTVNCIYGISIKQNLLEVEDAREINPQWGFAVDG